MPSSTLQPISPDVCYPLPVFMEMTGQGRHALATAQNEGLVVRKRGSRKYVMGEDWIQFLKNTGKTDDR